MNNLVVDIGNTRVKIAVMNGCEIVELYNVEAFDHSVLYVVEELKQRYGLERGIVASTRGDGESAVRILSECLPSVLLFDSHTPVPIKNSYSTPDTLGRDRLAAAVGAAALYGEMSDSQLIVDLGSALTIDYVTRDGGFEGGVISPGIDMRFRALHEFTANLPRLSATISECEGVAKSTREAIEQGVMEGIKFEIEGNISKFGQLNGKNIVIFTGGDSKYLANRIKNAIFAECELVLVGLNIILNYNAE